MTRSNVPKRKPKPKRPSGCGTPCNGVQFGTYAQIVRDYQRNGQRYANWVANFDSDPDRSYDEVLESVAFARLPNGKRHPHQRRLANSTLKKAYRRLRQYDLESCETFHELFETVEEAIAGMHGIGELMVYDTAARLGSHLGLEPEQVYVHAGVRAGAIALGHPRSTKWIDPKELPKAFRKLTPGEIEDCLCIYKDELSWISEK